MKHKDSFFSLSDFKKWIENKHDDTNRLSSHEFVGTHVESRINLKTLKSKMISDECDIDEMAEDFSLYGGIVLENKNNHFVIECDSGFFQILKKYVKKAKD